jgi:transcriptional regulator with XRE-family HTH domain
MKRTPSKPIEHDPGAVKEAREAAGLSQYALAKLLGVVRSLVSEIEGGTRNAKPEMQRRIARILGCPVADLAAKKPQGQTTPAAHVDVQPVRNGERAVPVAMPELRR